MLVGIEECACCVESGDDDYSLDTDTGVCNREPSSPSLLSASTKPAAKNRRNMFSDSFPPADTLFVAAQPCRAGAPAAAGHNEGAQGGHDRDPHGYVHPDRHLLLRRWARRGGWHLPQGAGAPGVSTENQTHSSGCRGEKTAVGDSQKLPF